MMPAVVVFCEQGDILTKDCSALIAELRIHRMVYFPVMCLVFACAWRFDTPNQVLQNVLKEWAKTV